ncbi:MAG TPA: hypothetical protein VJ867_05915 [Gemmatimonadaceae bacterium]|nr:hypothetical protein [Gemmatimonadaceae bacterium]
MAVAASLDAPQSLVKLLQPWSHAYSDSKVLPTVVVFLHIAALLFAGGYAVTLDRFTLRAFRSDPATRTSQLRALAVSHRIVLSGLALSLVSGVLLFAADVETFWTSVIWWTKAGLIVLLLLNGYGITRLEHQLRTSTGDGEVAWRGLRRTAVASIVLWFAIALAGVALVNAG